MEKRCSSCKAVKPLTAFYARKKGVPPTSPQTTGWHCKECVRLHSASATRKMRAARLTLADTERLITKYENRLAQLYAAQDRLKRMAAAAKK